MAIAQILIQLLQIGAQVLPEWIAAYNKVRELVASDVPPTPAEQASIDAAFDAAVAHYNSVTPAAG